MVGAGVVGFDVFVGVDVFVGATVVPVGFGVVVGVVVPLICGYVGASATLHVPVPPTPRFK